MYAYLSETALLSIMVRPYYGPLIGSRRRLGGRSIRDGSNDLECQ